MTDPSAFRICLRGCGGDEFHHRRTRKLAPPPENCQGPASALGSSLHGHRHSNAFIPVTACPMISECTSCVPSYV